MKLKSLLTSAMLVGAVCAAQAFPSDFTVYPTPGETVDNTYYFANINLMFGAGHTVAASETAYAYFTADDTGDEVYSENFEYNEMFEAVLINFPADYFTANGGWTLVIPANQFSVDGENNPQLTYSYTLDDPSLEIGEFPQIELVSVDPAEGSKFPVWGEAIGKINFKTTDDAAVNFIEWYLFDVTDGMNDDVTQGNECRIDPERAGNTDDRWADGLWISLAGNEKLVKDHKYELQLTFCGIGYNVETGDYPNPNQIAKSIELKTNVYYYGLTEPTEYSPYQVADENGVMPEPWSTFNDPEMVFFTITYTGPVKPVQFTYPLGFGMGSAVAGTFEPLGEVDADGYCDKWEFHISADAVNANQGSITVFTRAQDKDGLYVKGNSWTTFDDFDYQITYTINTALYELVSVYPGDWESVEELSTIVIGNRPTSDFDGAGTDLNCSYLALGPAKILDMFGGEIRVLGEPQHVEGDNTRMKWEFEPITEPGSYVLMIPDTYFNFGTEFDNGGTSVETYFNYTIPMTGEVTYDLVPATVSPEAGSTLTSLEKVTLTFDQVVYPIAYPENSYEPYRAILYKVNGEDTELVGEAEAQKVDIEDRFPKEYFFDFSRFELEKGEYSLVIRQGTFGDENYDMTMQAMGRACPELIYNYKVGETGAVIAISEASKSADIVSITGAIIKRAATAADIDALPAGIYIINGKKVIK